MKKLLAVSVCSLTFGFAALNTVFATTTENPDSPAAVTATEAVEQAQEASFEGIIISTSNGPALLTEEGNYLLAGGEFENLIDKKVSIQGELLDDGEMKKIQVARMALITE